MRYRITKTLSITLIICFVIMTVSACGNRQNLSVSKNGLYFDTIIKITLYGTDDESLIDECFELASEYENLLSNTIETSDISRINNTPGEYVEVDPKTIDVLRTALDYCSISDGAFDITIGNLSELWNISEISKNAITDDNSMDESAIPDSDTIKELLTHVDFRKIDIKDYTVCLQDSGAKIDLGGIAKGYIADQMRSYLNEHNVREGIINLGGNILTLGPKSSGSEYLLGLQYPFKESGEVICSLSVTDHSVVTSGIYERYFKVNNQIYHHILDTKTGYPVETDLYSVTIINSDSASGDALSTITLSLGLDKGLKFINSLDNTEAIFITNEYEIIYTDGLDGHVSTDF